MEKLNHEKTINTTYGRVTKTKEKGITLIALVITIIVLLILAGVAIATLLGENGIITRATTAKEKTQRAGAVERVQVEVQGSYGADGFLDYTELQKNLNNVQGIDKSTIPSPIESTSFPIKVTVDGMNIEIKENGEVKLAFDAKEWDKTACKEDSFLWASNDPKDGEAYHTIVGYSDSITNEIVFKIPSRCHEIRCDSGNWDKSGRTFAEQNFSEVYLPETLTNIGPYAFSNFNLERITIPDSVKNIGAEAFYWCKNLTKIILQNGVTTIGWSAFDNCTKLKEITIPESVTKIVSYAFKGCTALTKITIQSSVINIEYDAFGREEVNPISNDAVFYVVKDSYADTWLKENKYGNQTIKYITQ